MQQRNQCIQRIKRTKDSWIGFLPLCAHNGSLTWAWFYYRILFFIFTMPWNVLALKQFYFDVIFMIQQTCTRAALEENQRLKISLRNEYIDTIEWNKKIKKSPAHSICAMKMQIYSRALSSLTHLTNNVHTNKISFFYSVRLISSKTTKCK